MTLSIHPVFAASPEGVLDAAARARTLRQKACFREAVTVLDEAITEYGNTAVPLLLELHACYQRMPQSRHAQYVWRYFNFGLPEGARVLDLGGVDPLPNTTHVAVARRRCLSSSVEAAVMLVSEPEDLSLVDDDAFDFVTCIEMLERSAEPGRICSEMTRVARAGYIESPNPGRATFTNAIADHRFGVTLTAGVLRMREYPPYERAGLGSDLFRHMQDRPSTPREKALAALMVLRAERVNTMLHWVDDFPWEVTHLDGSIERSTTVRRPVPANFGRRSSPGRSHNDPA